MKNNAIYDFGERGSERFVPVLNAAMLSIGRPNLSRARSNDWPAFSKVICVSYGLNKASAKAFGPRFLIPVLEEGLAEYLLGALETSSTELLSHFPASGVSKSRGLFALIPSVCRVFGVVLRCGPSYFGLPTFYQNKDVPLPRGL